MFMNLVANLSTIKNIKSYTSYGSNLMILLSIPLHIACEAASDDVSASYQNEYVDGVYSSENTHESPLLTRGDYENEMGEQDTVLINDFIDTQEAVDSFACSD